jgi:hypothetical protein
LKKETDRKIIPKEYTALITKIQISYNGKSIFVGFNDGLVLEIGYE